MQIPRFYLHKSCWGGINFAMSVPLWQDGPHHGGPITTLIEGNPKIVIFCKTSFLRAMRRSRAVGCGFWYEVDGGKSPS